jgi:hypothetical protein
MSRPRVYADAAARQRAYRKRVNARRQAAQGPTDTQLARAVRDLHVRLEYVASTDSKRTPSGWVGKDALETFQNVVARLSALEPFE